MSPKRLDQLLTRLDTQPSADLDQRITEIISQAAAQGAVPRSGGWALWRTIMQSKTMRVAAVIAIAAVVVAVFLSFGRSSSVTWAGVIEPLMTAETAVFDLVTDYEGVSTASKVMVMGPRIRCEFAPSANLPTTIFDTERMQLLYLIPEKKQAVVIDLKDVPDEAPENYLASIRYAIREMQNDPEASIERLADGTIDGRDAVGFRAQNAHGEVTVWANPETLIPMQLEQRYDNLDIVCTNFQFDVALNPALFSMDIPDGYSTASGQLDLGDAAEQELLEGLRIWAQVLEDDRFPEEISVASYMGAMPRVSEKLKNGTLKLSAKEKLDMGLAMNRCFQFIAALKAEQDWHYVGSGVRFGDADRPVCWYKPLGSQTYRVVYGDMSVKDRKAEDLPE